MKSELDEVGVRLASRFNSTSGDYGNFVGENVVSNIIDKMKQRQQQ